MKFSRGSFLFNLSSINNEIFFFIFRTYQELRDHWPYFHRNLFHVIQQMKRTKRENNEEASERGCNEERKNRRERVEWGRKHFILWAEALLKFEKWNFSSLTLLNFFSSLWITLSMWIRVDPYESPGIPIDPRGFLWIPIDPRGFLWIPIESPWIPMNPHGSPWIPMDPHGSPWIRVDPHGSPWIRVDPQEFYVDPRGCWRNLRLLKTSNQASWRNRMKFWFYVDPHGSRICFFPLEWTTLIELKPIIKCNHTLKNKNCYQSYHTKAIKRNSRLEINYRWVWI